MKKIVFEKVQLLALKYGLAFCMDDINEKEELVFYLNNSTSSFVLHFEIKTEYFTVKVKYAERGLLEPFKTFNFHTLESCMECLSALKFYHSQVLETVKEF